MTPAQSITVTREPNLICPWVARVNGEPLRTSKGARRRFSSFKTALKAAHKAADAAAAKAATAP